MLATALGHELVAVLAVLFAFFIGLALGACVFGGAVRRSPRPERWYAALECGIALWALGLAALIPVVNERIPQWLGAEPSALRHWGLAFGATLLLLLPGTAAIGGTLPALERALARPHSRSSVAALYAASTFGAVLGVLATTFWLVPSFGYRAALASLAGVNLACAAALWILVRRRSAGAALSRGLEQPAPPVIGSRRLLLTLFITGLLGIGYEVLVIRVLQRVLENTVYTFAVVLAVYLLGTAGGAAAFRRLGLASTESAAAPELERQQALDKELSRLLSLTSACSLLGVLSLARSPAIYAALRASLEPGSATALAAEALVSFSVLALPTACMGASFAHLAQRSLAGPGLGLGLCVNTLGSALAPLVFGVLLPPLMGTKTALVALGLGYLPLLPAPSRAARWALLPAGLAIALILLPLPLRFASVPPGGELLAQSEGTTAAVSVVRDAGGDRFLVVNDNFVMGGTASAFSDQRQGHIPLLLHGSPQRALFLGIGTGITFDAAKDHLGLHATGVELLPEVLGELHHFISPPREWALEPRLIAADARRFILASDEIYDVIVADLFHPSLDGAGSLYTVEHFEAVRRRLARGGLFCQWLPLYQLDLPTLQLIVRTFLSVFPAVEAHLGHYSLEQPIVALIGREAAAQYDAGWLETHVTHPPLQRRLVALRLNSDFALFGGFLGGAQALARFVGQGPLGSDDWPLVTFRAPAFTYGPPRPAAERLLALVETLREQRSTLLDPHGSPAARRPELSGRSARGGPLQKPTLLTSALEPTFAARLSQYWGARDAYLHAGVGIRPSRDVREMLAQTREPLLGVLRMSADFVPAYAPLLAMAEGLHRTDPSAARLLLDDIEAASPARPETRLLRRRLFPE